MTEENQELTHEQKLQQILDSPEWLIAHRRLKALEMVENMLIKAPDMETGLPGTEILRALGIEPESITYEGSDLVWTNLAIRANKRVRPYCVFMKKGLADTIYHRDGDIQKLDEEHCETIEERFLPYPP